MGALPRAEDTAGQQFELTNPKEVREMAEQALSQMYDIEYDKKLPLNLRVMGFLWGLRHPRERQRARERLANPPSRELAARLLDPDQDRGE